MLSRAMVLVGLLVLYFCLSIKFTYKVVRHFRTIDFVKYSSINPSVVTVTPKYTHSPDHDEASQDESSDPVLNLSNQEFLALGLLRRPFELDDTEALKNSTQAKCTPANFGYSAQKGEQVFPTVTYANCSSLMTKAPAHINLDHTQLSVECSSSKTITYTTDQHLTPNRLWRPADLTDLWEVKTYHKPTEVGSAEFVYASCDETTEFSNAVYIPTLNETAYTRTKTLMDSKNAKRPLTILMLTLDSYSRRHFFRKLPKTVEYLNSLNNASDFSVYDFKIHNLFGATSVDNILPIFASKAYPDFTEIDTADVMRDIVGESALWRIFREHVGAMQGYVTYVGFEDCDRYFPDNIGRFPEADHLTNSFYCAAYKFLNIRMSKGRLVDQRCIGPHMSHYYALNYTQSLSDLYSDLNQWFYLHINTAHEASGQHAATLDDDLVDFLQKYLTKDRDYVIVMQADHGMRYGNWYKDIEAYQENKLPALFLIASNTLLNRIPGSYDTLWHNSQRLTTKPDLRATVLQLMMQPYNLSYPFHEDPYLDPYYDLFTEKVPNNRTCNDAAIQPWFCSCLVLTEVEQDLLDTDQELSNLVRAVVDSALLAINTEVYSPHTMPSARLCKRLSLESVAHVYAVKYSNVLEQIQVQFRVAESSSALFEAFAIVGTDLYNYIMRPSKNKVPLTSFTYRGYKTKILILGLQRKDAYAGPCEVLSASFNLRSDLCICQDQDYLERYFPRALDTS
jgi:hypothetical protein